MILRLYKITQFIIHKIFRPNTILVLGDSHADIFKNSEFSARFPLKRFIMANVHGATASGLENPNAKTQAMAFFIQKLNEIKADRILISLGEVDTGFVIWYRAAKHNTSVDSMYFTATNNYMNLILKAKSYAPVTVISTPLPTIGDNNTWGDVANLRKEITASQQERTKLTLKFNQEIEAFCKKHGITYVSLDDECIGDDGVVKEAYRNKDRTDHHYSAKEYAKLLYRYRNVIFGRSR